MVQNNHIEFTVVVQCGNQTKLWLFISKIHNVLMVKAGQENGG